MGLCMTPFALPQPCWLNLYKSSTPSLREQDTFWNIYVFVCLFLHNFKNYYYYF